MSEWRGVRWREDVGWEMRCDSCASTKKQAAYWPLTHEFWDYRHGLRQCRACWVTYAREKRRGGVTVSTARAKQIRDYQREWAQRKRDEARRLEGRERYERRRAA